MSDKHLLIIEDDSHNVYALSALLDIHDYTYGVARDWEEAMAKLDEMAQIDVVLTDINLPLVSGFELIPKIRQHATHGEVPIVAVTALAMDGDRERCLAAGADAYVPKPIDGLDLLKVIESVKRGDAS